MNDTRTWHAGDEEPDDVDAVKDWYGNTFCRVDTADGTQWVGTCGCCTTDWATLSRVRDELTEA